MKESKRIPLLSGLIGRKSGSIHSQLEVSLINYDTIHVAIRRKAFCGLPDVEFTIPDTDLQEIIDIFDEAKKKADKYYWTSRVEDPRARTPKEPSKEKRTQVPEDKISFLTEKYAKKGYKNPELVLEKEIFEKVNLGKTKEQAIDELYEEESSSS